MAHKWHLAPIFIPIKNNMNPSFVCQTFFYSSSQTSVMLMARVEAPFSKNSVEDSLEWPQKLWSCHRGTFQLVCILQHVSMCNLFYCKCTAMYCIVLQLCQGQTTSILTSLQFYNFANEQKMQNASKCTNLTLKQDYYYSKARPPLINHC